MQKTVFKQNEGNEWHKRNNSKLENKDMNTDPIVKAFLASNIDLSNKKVLEIGCGTGYRLNYLSETYNCKCYGIDPSQKAIEYGKIHFPKVELLVGTADEIDYETNSFDIVIFGFCLYLVDREHLFDITSKVNKILKTSGLVIIFDFYSNRYYKNPYIYYKSINSYKVDYSTLFTWNPQYIEIYKRIFDYDDFDKTHDIQNADNICITSIVQKFNKDIIYRN